MANTVIALKKSGTPSAIPVDLANGEIAINYADGKIFYKSATGSIQEISGGGNSFGTVNANGTLIVSDTTGDVFSLVPGPGITIVGDAINDSITISSVADVSLPYDTANAAYDQANAAYDYANTLISGGASVTVSNTAPTSPSGGDLWWNSQNGRLFVYYIDENSSQWVDTSATIGVNYFDVISGISAYNQANLATTIGSSAYDKANSANSLAYDTGIGANAYSNFIGISVNTFTSATIAGANAAVGTGANSYADVVGSSANTYLLSVIAGANNISEAAFNQANTAKTIANTAYDYANSVGLIAEAAFDTANNSAIGISAYDQANLATTIGSSAYDKANSANVLAYNTGIGANSYADVVGSSANTYLLSVIAGANTEVGIGANSFASATIAGANTAVGTGANSYSDIVGTSANAFAIATIAGANAAVGAGANTVGSAAFDVANTKLSSSGGTITGDLSIVGNLSVSGNTSYISVQNYRVDDSLIYLAGNNYISDIIDIGFIANYVNSTGSNVHTGLYREHTNKEYYLFYGYDQEPDNNHIDPNGNNFTLAVLNTDIRTSNLVLGGQNTITWLRSVYDKANAANLLAYNTGIGANAFASATIAGANVITFAAFAKANLANDIAVAAFNQANSTIPTNVVSQIFVANGAQSTFTLGNPISQQNNTVVSVDGLVQIPGMHYTISDTTLTFTSNPINKSNIEVRLFATNSTILGVINGNASVYLTDVYGYVNTSIAAANAYTNTVGAAANTLAIAAFNKANSTTYTSNVVISASDNSNAALRITQTGSAAALVVEDSTNPDSTPFVIDASGNVGVGNTTPSSKLTVAGTIESTTGGVKFPDGSTQTSAGASTGKAIAMAIVFG